MGAVVFHGVEIPESLIAEEAQHHPSNTAAEARAAAGRALATKALLLRRAKALGIAAEPELDDDGREETAEAALIRVLLDTELSPRTPTDDECRRVYDAQRHRFRTPLLYEAAHILIPPDGDDDDDAWERARATAEVAVRALGAAPERFAELAQALSDCPSATVGGSLGQLRPGDLVAEVEAVLLHLAPGQIAAAPVRSRFGWHIVKLDRRIEGRDLPFEHAVEHIRRRLERRAWSVAAARYVMSLAEDARSQGVPLAYTEAGEVSDGSVCLGDFLGGGPAAERVAPWLAARDPALAARVSDAAAAAACEPAVLVRSATAEFVNRADDEAWTQLISAAQGASDPALAAIAAILNSRLEPPKRNYTVIARRSGL
ncbi:MAG: peptidylprolyl isomerase [Caulobacterales bacterium]